MCTTDEIRERLKELPEIPNHLMSFATPEVFHGIVEWEVKKGKMIAFTLLDHNNCEVFHTRFSKNTELQWHSHGNESEQVIVCLEGSITFVFENGTKFHLNEKDKCLIPKEAQHMAVIGDKPCQIIAMTIPKEKYE